jgi:hypothetical protein
MLLAEITNEPDRDTPRQIADVLISYTVDVFRAFADAGLRPQLPSVYLWASSQLRIKIDFLDTLEPDVRELAGRLVKRIAGRHPKLMDLLKSSGGGWSIEDYEETPFESMFMLHVRRMARLASLQFDIEKEIRQQLNQ